MTRYPHQLYICDANTATLGTTGNWTVTPGSYSLLCNCREEPGGSGGEVRLNDGTMRHYSSMIYLPVGVTTVAPGQKLYVNDENGTLRFTGEVIRVSYDRKHTRIWA